MQNLDLKVLRLAASSLPCRTSPNGRWIQDETDNFQMLGQPADTIDQNAKIRKYHARPKLYGGNALVFRPSHLNPPTLSNSCCSSILQKLAPTSLSCIWKDPWHFPPC